MWSKSWTENEYWKHWNIELKLVLSENFHGFWFYFLCGFRTFLTPSSLSLSHISCPMQVFNELVVYQRWVVVYQRVSCLPKMVEVVLLISVYHIILHRVHCGKWENSKYLKYFIVMPSSFLRAHSEVRAPRGCATQRQIFLARLV